MRLLPSISAPIWHVFAIGLKIKEEKASVTDKSEQNMETKSSSKNIINDPVNSFLLRSTGK